MDNFNFRRVHEIMTLLKWEWVSCDDSVPEEYQIREAARKYLREVYNYAVKHKQEYSYTGSGGIYAGCYIGTDDEKEFCTLELEFVAEAWKAENE